MQNKSIESGTKLFTRIKSENNILSGINPHIFTSGGPFGQEVIEVNFPENIDYTDFLIDIITRAIMPTKLNSEFKECQVILLLTDFQVDLFKIIKFIEKKLILCNVPSSEKIAVIEESLKRLVILRCYSSDQFEISCHNLERILNNCKNPGLLILDNILLQYWTKKYSENLVLSFDEHCTKTTRFVYEKIKDLNLVFLYGRPLAEANSKRDKNVGLVIQLEKTDMEFVANVNSLEKNICNKVRFTVDAGLQFVD